MKHYLIHVIHISESTSDLLFIIFCVTSPITGILFGGFLIQRFGGYEHINCLYYVCINTFLCSCFAVSVGFIYNPYAFSVIMWFLLFCGSSIGPCVGGSVLAVLPYELRGSGYSLQTIVTNVVGYSPAPYVYGAIYESTKNTKPTMALTTCLSVSFIGFLMTLITICLKNKNKPELISDFEDQEINEDQEIKGAGNE